MTEPLAIDWPAGREWPDVADAAESTDGLILRLRIPRSVRWFEGHFPGEPVLAGVVQLHWAIELARAWRPALGTFRGVEGLKFQHVIQPNLDVTLRLEHDRDAGRLRFRYEHPDGVCSQGRVSFE